MPGFSAIFKAVSFSFWLWFVLADVAGVAACFMLDVMPGRDASPLATYAIWLVLGIFAGLIHYGTAMSRIKGKDGPTDWASREEGLRLGRPILWITLAYLVLISAVAYPLQWAGSAGDEWLFLVVPDHMGASLSFFVAMLAAAAGTHHIYVPAPGGGPSSRAR